MRALFKAVILLGPALAAASLGGRAEVKDQPQKRAAQNIDVIIPGSTNSPDSQTTETLQFRLQVLASEEPCGWANVTINEVSLPQEQADDFTFGQGLVPSDRLVFASWSLSCVNIDRRPERQFLNFIIASIDGRAVKNAGFTAIFKQNGIPEILQYEATPFHVIVNESDSGPHGDEENNTALSNFELAQQMAELEWLRAQLRELVYLIDLKEESIAHRDPWADDNEIMQCDSIKCSIKSILSKARCLAGRAYTAIARQEHDRRDSHNHRKPHSEYKVEHTRDTKEQHPNVSHEHDHVHHMLPQWREPHLPVCRYPPPLSHGPQHPRPPLHHPPPPDVEATPLSLLPLPSAYHRPLVADDQRPSSEHEDDNTSIDQGQVYSLDHPSHDDVENNFVCPHHGSGSVTQHVRNAADGLLLALLILALHRRFCFPQWRKHRAARLAQRQYRRTKRRAGRKAALKKMLWHWSRTVQTIFKDSGCEEEEKEVLLTKSDADVSVAEMEEGRSATMSEDLQEFSNVAEVLGQMIAAESNSHKQSCSTSAPSSRRPAHQHQGPQMRTQMGVMMETSFSDVGDDESLPVYREDDRPLEPESVVADGFQYIPGSTDYTPSHSTDSSVDDVLGADGKQ